MFIDTATGLPRDVFTFDRCFCSITKEQWQSVEEFASLPKEGIPPVPPCASQEDIFACCGQPVVDAVLDGFNASILAYGQTSSGKTYTMMGTPQNEGLIPRIGRAVMVETQKRSFEGGGTAPAADSSDTGDLRSPKNGSITSASLANLGGTVNQRDFVIEMSFFEIYNEAVLDLLQQGQAQHRKRKVRIHPMLGVYVEGLMYERVTTWQQCLKFLQRGLQLRHTAATKMNSASSRSHAIFQLRIIQTDLTDIGPIQKRSNIYLADLAGSERIKLSAVEGDRLKEAAQINLSLTTLRRVIDALIAQQSGSPSATTASRSVVPYRDSMLTWVLSESLGGNAKACMVATLCPHPLYSEETYNTLQYASRAKSIVNVVVKNEDQMAKMIRQLQDAIQGKMSEPAKQAIVASEEAQVELRQERDAADKVRAELIELEERHRLVKCSLEEMREAQSAAEQENIRITAALHTLTQEYEAARSEAQHWKSKHHVVAEEMNDVLQEVKALRKEHGEREAYRKLFERDREKHDAERRSLEEHTEDLANECQRLRNAVLRLQDQLLQMREEHRRVLQTNAAAVEPMLRWHRNATQITFDAFGASKRAQLLTQITLWACDRAIQLQRELGNQLDLNRSLEGTVKDLQLVSASQDESLTQVAQTYVEVREFLRHAEIAQLERSWTTASLLGALRTFCAAAKDVPAVALRGLVTTGGSIPKAARKSNEGNAAKKSPKAPSAAASPAKRAESTGGV
jgi:ribulose bisphosphate carboxylase small subunit